MNRPVPTHYVIIHSPKGKYVFRGTHVNVRQHQIKAIKNGTTVSGIKEIVNVVR